MGIQQVRLYTNTISTPPTTFTDVTTHFSGLDPNTVADEVASATITLSNLPSATTVFAWIEALDEAGNSSGIQPVGSATTSPPPIIGRGLIPSGASWLASSRFDNNPVYGAYSAISGTFLSTQTLHSSPFPHWYQFFLPTSVVVLEYRIWAAPDETFKDAPIDWTLQGSSDGTSWAILDTRVNSEPPNTSGLGLTSDSPVTLLIPYGEYVVATPGSYTYYRLHVTKTGGGTGNRTTVLKVGELELLGV